MVSYLEEASPDAFDEVRVYVLYVYIYIHVLYIDSACVCARTHIYTPLKSPSKQNQHNTKPAQRRPPRRHGQRAGRAAGRAVGQGGGLAGRYLFGYIYMRTRNSMHDRYGPLLPTPHPRAVNTHPHIHQTTKTGHGSLPPFPRRPAPRPLPGKSVHM